MEYLPSPKDPALPPIEVTFRDPLEYWYDPSWREYISGTYWNNFPKRYGYDGESFWEDSGPYSNKAWAHPGFHAWLMQQSRDELEGMAIGWLFFGTLAEVTGCYLDIANYLRVTDDGRFVLKMTEKSMDAILERWFTVQTRFRGSIYVRGVPEPEYAIMMDHEARIMNKDGIQTQYDTPVPHGSKPMAKLNAQGKSPQFERAHKCIRQSKAIIGFLCEAINTKTVYVIAALHEFLAKALTGVVFKGEVARKYDTHGAYSLGKWTLGNDFEHYTREILHNLGWCPRTTAQFLKDTSRTLAVDYFMTNLKSPQTLEDHSKCSEDVCAAYQLNPDEYKVAHAPEECFDRSCSHLELDPIIASAVLQSDPDSFPLIVLSPETNADEGSVEILDAASEDDYVAISHVWSHGLGNPRKNSLPTCQLQRIQNYANDLASQAAFKQNPMPFWMDTLCCPLEPRESRRAAIMKMRQTYERASHVLVLDKNVCSISTTGLSKLELLMKIYGTTWMTRLWTLQEARYAKQLWFQFKDKAINLETLNQEFEAEFFESPSRIVSKWLFQDNVRAKLSALRESSHKGTIAFNSESLNVLSRMLTMIYSLGGRSTSWATDEAICICNIMGLDLEPILEFSTEEPSCASLRMAAMWKQWPVVPPSIIFNKAPRLSQRGYRWAQSTFVRTGQSLGLPLLDMFAVATVDPGGEGLMVSMRGFILQSVAPVVLAEMNMGTEKVTDPRHERQSGTGGLGTRPTCIIYDISEDSLKWYDLQIRRPVHEVTPDFDHEDDYAILFSEETNAGNIDSRQKPALLVSIRKVEDGIIYVTSLYHVAIARSEAAVEKLFTAGLKVRDIMAKHDIEPQPLMQLDLSKAIPPQDLNTIKAITAIVHADPQVQSYTAATILKNRDPRYMKWLTSSEERRMDWKYRATSGDVAIFKEHTVNCWLSLASPVIPLSKNQRWCVD